MSRYVEGGNNGDGPSSRFQNLPGVREADSPDGHDRKGNRAGQLSDSLQAYYGLRGFLRRGREDRPDGHVVHRQERRSPPLRHGVRGDADESARSKQPPGLLGGEIIAPDM